MKRIFLIFVLISASPVLTAQNKFVDSLKMRLPFIKNDTAGVLLLSDLCYYFRYTNIDSTLYYGNAGLALARKLKFLRGEADVLNKLGLAYREKGDLPKSLELQFMALEIASENNYIEVKANCLRRIGHVYRDLRDFSTALRFSHEALGNSLMIQDIRGESIEYMNLAITFMDMKDVDSASFYASRAYQNLAYLEDVAVEVYRLLGDISSFQGKRNEGMSFYNQGIKIGLANDDYRTLSYLYSDMALMYKNLNNRDSAIYCAKNGVRFGQLSSYKKGIMLSGNILSELYDTADPVEALNYFKMATAAKDSLYGAGNIQTIQNIVAKEQAREQEVEEAKQAYQDKIKTYSLVTAVSIISCIAFVLLWNDRRQKKANIILTKQKEELTEALEKLKATQVQLLHSEKMASLGELTAGIAHEIQNPLNFVNNFSELSSELVTEMSEEIDKGNNVEVKTIAGDLRDNLVKINHHGKRADSIVKGMLQHSRSNRGEREMTDINELTDECLRLGYHGWRGKAPQDAARNAFNVTLKTEFDPSVGEINIVSQDIAKVLLNVYNNAFYAVAEKAKADPSHIPELVVKTQKKGRHIEIIVQDNGTGIPEKIVDKIFQPFFTTKPTGQGTGLGLSLAFDIVKAHGGVISIEKNEPGKGARFIIRLPE